MDLDLVYLYVNANDEDWLNKRKQYSMDGSNQSCRFRDNGEFRFSLRSVEKYASWIRKIYIVTNSAMPEWFNAGNGKVCVVPHEEIMPTEILPCYNSNVIESYIHKIPGLSEVFLYMNDDNFFGDYVTPDFFVRDGKPIVRMVKAQFAPTTYYKTALCNANQLMEQHFGVKYELMPWHNVDTFSVTEMENCKEEFRVAFDEAKHKRLRTDGDIQKAIFQYYMIYRNTCSLVEYTRHHGLRNVWDYLLKIMFPRKYHDYMLVLMPGFANYRRTHLELFRKPKAACINDSEDTTPEHAKKYRELMNKAFPKKSSFEK